MSQVSGAGSPRSQGWGVGEERAGCPGAGGNERTKERPAGKEKGSSSSVRKDWGSGVPGVWEARIQDREARSSGSEDQPGVGEQGRAVDTQSQELPGSDAGGGEGSATQSEERRKV